MQESKRKFLRNGGLLGMFVAGASTPVIIEKTKEVIVEKKPEGITPDVLKQIESNGNGKLVIQSTYGEKKPKQDLTFSTEGVERFRVSADGTVGIGTSMSQYSFYPTEYIPETVKQSEVAFLPGPDGELYIRANGKWKKVLTA